MFGFKLKIFFLFIVIFITQTAFCNRPIGGEITYKHLGNNKYYVEITVLRDCRFNGLSGLTFGWFAGNGNNTSCGMGALKNFKRVKITDISVAHSDINKPCSPQNTASAEGIEAHTFIDTLDISKSPFASVFSNKSCTELSIYVSYCCRMSYYTNIQNTNTDFLITATLFIRNIEKCVKKNNSTPQFLRNHPGAGYCNRPVYWSLGALDSIDMDSLSFKLAAPLSTIAATTVKYQSPYSVQHPVNCYCRPNPSKIDCTPNINTTPTLGTFFDPITGDFIYTPSKCDAIEALCFEINEYRRDTSGNMLLIARNSRESVISIKDWYNQVPKINGNFSITVTKGDTIRTSFTIEDDLDTFFQKSRDTIQVSWTGASAEPAWTFTRDSLRSDKGRLDFYWNTNSANYSEFPYIFTIAVTDNHFKVPIVSMRTFTARIQPADTATILIQNNLECAGAKLTANLKKGDNTKATYNWVLRDSVTNNIIKTDFGSEFKIQNLDKGVYTAELRVIHPKYGYKPVKSNFNITADKPRVQLGQDLEICNGLPATITSTVSTLKEPVRYTWSVQGMIQTDSLFKLLLPNLDSTVKITVKSVDSFGCIAMDTLSVIVLPRPSLAWTSSPLPAQCWNSSPLLLNKFVTYPTAGQINKDNFRISGSLTQYGINGLVDSQGIQQYHLSFTKIDNASELQNSNSINETLTLWFKDSLGCENSVSSSIKIDGNPIVEIADKTICQIAEKAISLDSLIISPSLSFDTSRKWSLIFGPKTDSILTYASNGNTLFKPGRNPDNSYSGSYHLQYCVTNSKTGCKACDTNTITVLPQFAVEALKFTPICEGSGGINLSSYFLANGTFGDTGNSSYTILSRNGNKDPKTWVNGSITNGCIIPPTMPFGKWVVSFSPKSNKSFCSQSIEQLFEILPRPKAQFTTIPADSVGKDLPIFKTQNTSKISDNSKLSYQWYFDYPDLNNQSSAIAPDINYLAIDARYTVWLIASSDKGCADTAIKTLKVGNPVNGIASISLEQFRINPQFVVSGIAFTAIETEVYDAAGKLLARSNNNTPIALPTGIYLYKLSLKFGDTADILHLSGKVFVE